MKQKIKKKKKKQRQKRKRHHDQQQETLLKRGQSQKLEKKTNSLNHNGTEKGTKKQRELLEIPY